MSDTVANLKLTPIQQGRNKSIQKKGFQCPDLLIFEPRNGYAGLFIELKIKSPFKKNGELYSNKHIEGQAQTIAALQKKGYKACFAWSFDQIKIIIDNYLQKK